MFVSRTTVCSLKSALGKAHARVRLSTRCRNKSFGTPRHISTQIGWSTRARMRDTMQVFITRVLTRTEPHFSKSCHRTTLVVCLSRLQQPHSDTDFNRSDTPPASQRKGQQTSGVTSCSACNDKMCNHTSTSITLVLHSLFKTVSNARLFMCYSGRWPHLAARCQVPGPVFAAPSKTRLSEAMGGTAKPVYSFPAQPCALIW